MDELIFEFGDKDLVLALPPFFIDFETHNIHSLVSHDLAEKRERNGVNILIFITKSLQLNRLSVLKEMHQDITFLHRKDIERKDIGLDEIKNFQNAILKIEKDWPYMGNGIWMKQVDSVTIRMVLVVEDDRWTIRPAISRKRAETYNVEIPVISSKAEDFTRVLREGELEEIHEHNITKHFHLSVGSLDRYIELVKEWDYYFSKDVLWPALFEFKMIE